MCLLRSALLAIATFLTSQTLLLILLQISERLFKCLTVLYLYFDEVEQLVIGQAYTCLHVLGGMALKYPC